MRNWPMHRSPAKSSALTPSAGDTPTNGFTPTSKHRLAKPSSSPEPRRGIPLAGELSDLGVQVVVDALSLHALGEHFWHSIEQPAPPTAQLVTDDFAPRSDRLHLFALSQRFQRHPTLLNSAVNRRLSPAISVPFADTGIHLTTCLRDGDRYNRECKADSDVGKVKCQ